MDEVRAAVVSLRAPLSVLGALVAIGCQRAGDAAEVKGTNAVAVAPDTSYRTQPGYVVDSILSPDEALRRFRVGIHERPVRFEGGATSRNALVRTFARALETRDTL